MSNYSALNGAVSIGSELPVHWRKGTEGLFGRTAHLTLCPGDGPWEPPLEAGQVWMVKLVSHLGPNRFLVVPIKLDPYRGNHPTVDTEGAEQDARPLSPATNDCVLQQSLIGRKLHLEFTEGEMDVVASYEGRIVIPDRRWRGPRPKPNQFLTVEVVGESRRYAFVLRAT